MKSVQALSILFALFLACVVAVAGAREATELSFRGRQTVEEGDPDGQGSIEFGDAATPANESTNTKNELVLDSGSLELVNDGEKHRVRFNVAFASVPSVHIVFSSLHIPGDYTGTGEEKKIAVVPKNINTEGFDVGYELPELEDQATQAKMTVSWVAYLGNSKVTLLNNRIHIDREAAQNSMSEGWHIVQEHVEFEKAFTNIPRVTVALCAMSVSNILRPQLHTTISDITTFGFDIEVKWFGTSGVVSDDVCWLAVPDHPVTSKNIVVGEASLTDKANEVLMPSADQLTKEINVGDEVSTDSRVTVALAGVDVSKGLDLDVSSGSLGKDSKSAPITVEVAVPLHLFGADVSWVATSSGTHAIDDTLGSAFSGGLIVGRDMDKLQTAQPGGSTVVTAEGDDNSDYTYVYTVVGVIVVVPGLLVASIFAYQRYHQRRGGPVVGSNNHNQGSPLPGSPTVGKQQFLPGMNMGKPMLTDLATEMQQMQGTSFRRSSPKQQQQQSVGSPSIRRDASPQQSAGVVHRYQLDVASAAASPKQAIASPARQTPSSFGSGGSTPRSAQAVPVYVGDRKVAIDAAKLAKLRAQMEREAKSRANNTMVASVDEVRGVEAVTRLVTAKGAAVVNALDVRGYSLMHHAVSRGHKMTVDALVKYGGNVNIRDANGNAPIHWATQTGNLEMVQKLITLGAQVKICNKAKQAPLHIAAREGHDAIVDTLLAACPEVVNQFDGANKSPLAHAIISGKLRVVTQLLDRTASDILNSQDVDGCTALINAVKFGRVALVSCLSGAGAAVTIGDRKSWTPLHWAAASGSAKVMEILLSNCISSTLNQSNAEGESPLHLAARGGHADVVKLLVSAGAETHLQDAEGRFPLVRAEENRHTEVRDYLRLTNGI
eukprot:GFYU01000714.1.p1 GENE.GFYU01000714.1~~GFYU01000714.1.p1  ORF type:complete len:889 (-),score=279.04 GFYU01000714.1:1027-3693(-)